MQVTIPTTPPFSFAQTLAFARRFPPCQMQSVIEHATRFVGARDDLASFYAAAQDDVAFVPIVELLHGLHHVRFLTLAEISVYSVLMQRTPVHVAAASLGRFLRSLGHAIDVPERTLFAMPALDELCELTVERIAAAIQHRAKAERIVDVVRGVRAIGENVLRDAPYEHARDALLSIRGVGHAAIAKRYGSSIGYWSFYMMTGLPRLDAAPCA